MAKGRNLHIPCDTCGKELNTWDVRACKALGYKNVLVMEKILGEDRVIELEAEALERSQETQMSMDGF